MIYGPKKSDEQSQLEPPPAKKQKTLQTQDLTPEAPAEISAKISLKPVEKESKSAECSQEDEGFKIDFFTPAPIIPEAEPISSALSIEFMQRPCSEAPEKIDLSEASSDDEAPTVSPENSILCTPDTNQIDDGDFTLTEENEAALMELEKLLNCSQNSSAEATLPKGFCLKDS